MPNSQRKKKKKIKWSDIDINSCDIMDDSLLSDVFTFNDKVPSMLARSSKVYMNAITPKKLNENTKGSGKFR